MTASVTHVQEQTPLAETRTRTLLRHARATPLASIFGSGFLVIVPILNGAVGPYSVVAAGGTSRSQPRAVLTTSRLTC